MMRRVTALLLFLAAFLPLAPLYAEAGSCPMSCCVAADTRLGEPMRCCEIGSAAETSDANEPTIVPSLRFDDAAAPLTAASVVFSPAAAAEAVAVPSPPITRIRLARLAILLI